MGGDDFVARPERGRIVTIARHVGLADVRPDTTLRLDALARFLQDAADQDAASAGIERSGAWVLRRLAMRIDRSPRFRADLELATWCSGIGARWAERRTEVMRGEHCCVTAAGLWVHVDTATGTPAPLPDGFDATWGVAAGGRRVRSSLRHRPSGGDGGEEPWRLRATDLDVLRHVNNAAYWVPVEEELARRGYPSVTAAEMEFRGGLDRRDDVRVVTTDTVEGFESWYRVAGDVRASALVACAS